jgi:hypothetical protein
MRKDQDLHPRLEMLLHNLPHKPQVHKTIRPHLAQLQEIKTLEMHQFK